MRSLRAYILVLPALFAVLLTGAAAVLLHETFAAREVRDGALAALLLLVGAIGIAVIAARAVTRDIAGLAAGGERIRAGEPPAFANSRFQEFADLGALLAHAIGERDDLLRDRFALAQDVARAEALKEAEAALRQAQTMEAVDQVTGAMAHDFNNLLTPIVATLEFLRIRGLADARCERMVANAIEATERARALVQQLETLARPQPLRTGAVDADVRPESLAPRPETPLGLQARLQIAADEDLPPAVADADPSPGGRSQTSTGYPRSAAICSWARAAK